MATERPAGQLDPYHYEGMDAEDAARIDDLEREGATREDAAPSGRQTPGSVTDAAVDELIRTGRLPD